MSGVIKVDEIEKSSDTGTGIKLNSPLLNSTGTEIMSAAGVLSSSVDMTNADLSNTTFPAGHIVKTTIYNYAPNAIKNLYTGTNTDTLYYNPDFDTTVTITSGNKLIVWVHGGRVYVGTAGVDAFAFSLQIAGVDYQAGVRYLNDMPLNLCVGSDVINSTSVTIKLGGFARYDSRTPNLDLRNSVSNAGGGGTNGSPLRYIIQEVQV